MDALPYDVKVNVAFQGTFPSAIEHPYKTHDLQVFAKHIEEPKRELPFQFVSSRSQSDNDFLIFPFQVFSSVCQSWRDLVTSTPSLWNALYITDWTPIDVIVTHLTQSKALPLDLHLTFKDAHPDHVMKTIDLLRQHVLRWRTFKCRTNALIVVMMALGGLEAPSLEEFEVHDPFAETFHPADMYRYVTCTILKGPGSAPRLAAVRLLSMPVKWENHPFANLKELEIGSLTNGKHE